MAEYKVIIEGTKQFLFSSSKLKDMQVFEAASAAEAKLKGEKYIADMLAEKHMDEYDLEEMGIDISIVDIQRI